MVESVSTANMSREEWLAYRRRGIGGSDAAAVLGLSRWKSPFSVYCDKLGLEPSHDSTVMEMGTLLEPYVAELFCRETGKKVARRHQTYTRKEHPCMMANIDRYVVGEHVGLECKTTTKYNNVTWDAGEIPPDYFWQCTHYMAVMGYDHWYLAVLFRDTGDFKYFRLERDEAEIERLTAAEEVFWDNVLKRIPPESSGLESETQLIGELYPAKDAGPDEADLTPVYHEIESRTQLDEEIKRMQKTRDALDQSIKRAMGTCQVGQAGSYRVSWAAMQRSDIDRKKLASDYPQVLADVSRLSSYRRFEIKEAK